MSARTDLLNAFGQPCPARIEAQVEREMLDHVREGRVVQARRRALKRGAILAEASAQSARFGQSPDQVRALDIADELAALDYASMDRNERERTRTALRSEAAGLRRKELDAIARGLPRA